MKTLPKTIEGIPVYYSDDRGSIFKFEDLGFCSLVNCYGGHHIICANMAFSTAMSSLELPEVIKDYICASDPNTIDKNIIKKYLKYDVWEELKNDFREFVKLFR